MVVAVVAVGIVEMSVDQVVDMIPMRYRFMTAIRSVHMFSRVPPAPVPGRAGFRVVRGHGDDMFIDMAVMRMMQVAVMQITDMIVMHDARMAALGSVWMGMIFVLLQVTIGHRRSLRKKMN